jgi:hypothetical protein
MKLKYHGREEKTIFFDIKAELTIFEREFFSRIFVQHQREDLLLQKLLAVTTILTAVNENVEFSRNKNLI